MIKENTINSYRYLVKMIETLLQLSIIVGISFFVVWVVSPDKNVETYKKYIKNVIESTITNAFRLYPDQKSVIIYIRKRLLGN